MAEALFTAEDRAALARHVTVPDGFVEPPPGERGVAARTAPPDATPPPATEPPPAQPPATEPPPAPVAQPAQVDSAKLNELQQMQEKILGELDALGKSLVREEVRAGRAPAPQTDAEATALLERLERDSPEAAELGRRFVELNGKVDGLLAEKSQREAADQEANAVAAARDQLLGDADRLSKRFPGITEKDIEKVFAWVGDEKNDAEARRMHFGEIAEHVLGWEYLEARRKPPGVASGDAPSPPRAPTAKVVDQASPGGGAAPEPTAAPAGGIREVFADIRRNDLHRLGRYQ